MEFSDLDDSDTKTQVMAWTESVLSGKVIRTPGSPICGLGILLVGKPGHGKTTIASVALQSLIRGIPDRLYGPTEALPPRLGAFMDYPKLLRTQKAQWDEENESDQREIDAIFGDLTPVENLQLFVLDDLGKEYRTATGWAENTFDALLRSRFNSGLPTIITTNVPTKDWETVYGEPMSSFIHEAFIPLVVNAPKGDRRRNEKE
jgi:DNA replication protein DnaC